MTGNRLASAIALAALAVPAGASAHVTLQPEEAPAGGFARFDVRVRDPTTRGRSRWTCSFPPGSRSSSYDPCRAGP